MTWLTNDALTSEHDWDCPADAVATWRASGWSVSDNQDPRVALDEQPEDARSDEDVAAPAPGTADVAAATDEVDVEKQDDQADAPPAPPKKEKV